MCEEREDMRCRRDAGKTKPERPKKVQTAAPFAVGDVADQGRSRVDMQHAEPGKAPGAGPANAR